MIAEYEDGQFRGPWVATTAPGSRLDARYLSGLVDEGVVRCVVPFAMPAADVYVIGPVGPQIPGCGLDDEFLRPRPILAS